MHQAAFFQAFSFYRKRSNPWKEKELIRSSTSTINWKLELKDEKTEKGSALSAKFWSFFRFRLIMSSSFVRLVWTGLWARTEEGLKIRKLKKKKIIMCYQVFFFFFFFSTFDKMHDGSGSVFFCSFIYKFIIYTFIKCTLIVYTFMCT